MKKFTLADFEQKFQSKTALVLGSGTTNYDYENIKFHDGPIVFINDTIKISHFASANPNIFFCTLHASTFEYFINTTEATLIIPNSHFYAHYAPKQVLLYNLIYQQHLLMPCLETNTIFTRENSMIPGLAFLKICGCDNIDFIGCSSINGKFIESHDPRLGGDPNPYAEACFLAIKNVCETFNINTNFLG